MEAIAAVMLGKQLEPEGSAMADLILLNSGKREPWCRQIYA